MQTENKDMDPQSPNSKRHRKLLLSAVACVAVLTACCVIYSLTHCKLSDKIDSQLGSNGKYEIALVEKMPAEEGEPETAGVSIVDAGYDPVMSEINSASLAFKRWETGASFTDEPLYTLTLRKIADESKTMTLSVNSKGEVHLYNENATYSVVGGGQSFYENCEELFDEAVMWLHCG